MGVWYTPTIIQLGRAHILDLDIIEHWNLMDYDDIGRVQMRIDIHLQIQS